MDSYEEAAALEAQDGVLGDLLDYLNVHIKDYALILTADHGNTPPPERSGAWPIQQGQLQEDVDAHFNLPKDRSLIEETSAGGSFLDYSAMEEFGVTDEDVSRFLNSYTIADNWKEPELPEGYEERGGENVFSAAFPSDWIERVNRCAFGDVRPPTDIQALGR
jgi:hypothetical protein